MQAGCYGVDYHEILLDAPHAKECKHDNAMVNWYGSFECSFNPLLAWCLSSLHIFYLNEYNQSQTTS